MAEAERPTPRWRVKDETGQDLIDVWKRRPRGSDEYAATEIIEQLERDRDALRETIEHHEAQIEELNRKYLERSGEVFALQEQLATLSDAARRLAEAWRKMRSADPNEYTSPSREQGDAAAAEIEKP